MAIFDQDRKRLDEYDLELGWLEEHITPVAFYCYVDDNGDHAVRVTDYSGVELPEYDGHIPGNMPVDTWLAGEWKYHVYIPYTEEELLQNRITAQTPIAMQLCVMQAKLPDEQALQVEALYPDWKVGEQYAEDDIRRYKDELYRSLQASTGAAEHTPDVATSLWKKILPPEEPGGYLPWIQPLGATDAYNQGDRVTHKDQVWESTCNDNIWEPGVYGWEVIQ